MSPLAGNCGHVGMVEVAAAKASNPRKVAAVSFMTAAHQYRARDLWFGRCRRILFPLSSSLGQNG